VVVLEGKVAEFVCVNALRGVSVLLATNAESVSNLPCP